jgi:DNA-binding transcriptional MerR regulator
MTYSIKRIADLASVTTRTLRYYDEIGLLRPAGTGENGYRYYDQGNLLRLQQILFFRELDVPLDDILLIMSQPDFNLAEALEKHKKALKSRVSRLEKLINTVDQTIQSIKGKSTMKEEALFEGFDESKYEAEVKERWGNTPQYEESIRKLASYSREQKQAIKEEGGKLALRMVTSNSNAKPDDPDVQAAIEDYLAYFNKYFYTCDAEFLRNLSDMWVEDERFAINYERIREGGAKFLRDAVYIFADKMKENKS